MHQQQLQSSRQDYCLGLCWPRCFVIHIIIIQGVVKRKHFTGQTSPEVLEKADSVPWDSQIGRERERGRGTVELPSFNQDQPTRRQRSMHCVDP